MNRELHAIFGGVVSRMHLAGVLKDSEAREVMQGLEAAVGKPDAAQDQELILTADDILKALAA